MKASGLIILDSGSDAKMAWADVAILGEQLTVTPVVAESLCAQYPSISQHACKTATFGQHLPGALLPHALEHLTIELLVQTYPNETFAGTTRWLERSEQTMQVRVSVPSDGDGAATRRAFSKAIELLNGFVGAS